MVVGKVEKSWKLDFMWFNVICG